MTHRKVLVGAFLHRYHDERDRRDLYSTAQREPRLGHVLESSGWGDLAVGLVVALMCGNPWAVDVVTRRLTN